MSQIRREHDVLLLDGYIRLISLTMTQTIPQAMNQLCFNYFFIQFRFTPEAFHYENIIFISEDTIQTTNDNGYACIDYIIDSAQQQVFDFKVVIKNLKGIITVGCFGVTEDNKPAHRTDDESSGVYHHISSEGGAMVVLWSGRDSAPLAIDKRFKPTKRAQDTYRFALPQDMQEEIWNETEIGIRFDMKERKMKMYYDGVCVGALFEQLPPRIMPAIGMYGSFRATKEVSVTIKLEDNTT
eukprot:165774_1